MTSTTTSSTPAPTKGATPRFLLGEAEYAKLAPWILQLAEDDDFTICYNDSGLAIMKDGDFLAEDITVTDVERWFDGYQQRKNEQEELSQISNAAVQLPRYDKSHGEVYVGMALKPDGTPEHHIILLDSKKSAPLTWSDAIDWANEQSGALPTMRELALISIQSAGLLDDVIYWSDDQDRKDGDYIQCLNVVNGKRLSAPAASRNAIVVIRRVGIVYVSDVANDSLGGAL